MKHNLNLEINTEGLIFMTLVEYQWLWSCPFKQLLKVSKA